MRSVEMSKMIKTPYSCAQHEGYHSWEFHEPLLKQWRVLQEFPIPNLDQEHLYGYLHRIPTFRDENDQNASRHCSNRVSSTLGFTNSI